MPTTSTATFVKHLDHLNLTVADLDATQRFYADVFGFRRVDGGVQDGVRWAILQSGQALLCVYEHPELIKYANRERIRRGVHGLNHFALRITDRAAWEQALARAGLELLYGSPIRWPHSTAWYVRDPSGHEIEVALWEGDRISF